MKKNNKPCKECQQVDEPSFSQPDDGLIEDHEIFEVVKRSVNTQNAFDNIKRLLSAQRQKTKEDTLNNIEAIWTRLMNETDDPVYKEFYTSCIKALKI